MKGFLKKDEKIVGYIILVIGLCIMAYGIYSVFELAGTGAPPIEILTNGGADNTNQIITNTTNPQPNIDITNLITPLFPMFNVFIWLAIAFFIVVAGGRVSHIGIKMIKMPSERKKDNNKDS